MISNTKMLRFQPGEILLCTFRNTFKKLNVKGHLSQISRCDVKHVPVLTKNGLGLKKTPQHFLLGGVLGVENKYSPCMSHIAMKLSHLQRNQNVKRKQAIH
jgi:hypothetical protein